MLDVTKRPATAPFDTALLDRLMDDAGIDVLVATSKHNIQYLLGGHRSFFFEAMDAMGLSRYLPVFVYAKGAPQKAGFFGHRMDRYQNEVTPLWTSEINTKSSGTVDAIEKAADYMRRLNPKPKRIGIEVAFLPVDAAAVLRNAFAGSEFVDALFVLERLRARKTPEELEMLRIASDAVIDSMAAVIKNRGAGSTKAELAEALRREEVSRGLNFDYCLIAAGSSSTGRRPTRGGRRATCCRSIPAAITTAISATSRAWASPASRTPNSSTCSPKSKPSSRPR